MFFLRARSVQNRNVISGLKKNSAEVRYHSAFTEQTWIFTSVTITLDKNNNNNNNNDNNLNNDNNNN